MWSVQKNRKFRRSIGSIFKKVKRSRRENGILTPDMVLGPPRKGLKLTYTTDTRPTNSIRENAKDSDLFICEGMYGEKEKAAKQ